MAVNKDGLDFDACSDCSYCIFDTEFRVYVCADLNIKSNYQKVRGGMGSHLKGIYMNERIMADINKELHDDEDYKKCYHYKNVVSIKLDKLGL